MNPIDQFVFRICRFYTKYSLFETRFCQHFKYLNAFSKNFENVLQVKEAVAVLQAHQAKETATGAKPAE